MSFDRESLLEEYEDDTEMIEHMLGIFDRDYEQRVEKLRAAVASGDGGTIMSEAHALKGGLGNFFAEEAFQTAYKLEIMGRDNELDEAAATLSALEAEVEDLRAAIGQVVGG